MKRKFNKIMLVPITVVLIMASVFLIGTIMEWNHVTYSGKFNATHDQYEQFKLAAVNPDYSIGKLQIMNSEPVYIDFVITVPANESFPFGERNDAGRIAIIAVCLFGTVVTLAGTGYLIKTGFTIEEA